MARVLESFLPLAAMVVVQIGLAGLTIISEMAMETGMSPLVLVTYRQIVAAVVTAPYALYLERNRPPITKENLMHIFQCSVLGATANQLLYLVGLNNSTPTISCALCNILPAFTFILAVIFKLDALGMKKRSCQAKIAGTAVCIGGAMLLSLFHGPVVPIGQSRIHLNSAGGATTSSHHGQLSFFKGPFLVLLSNLSWGFWIIIQAKLSEVFDAPYTTTSLMSFMAALQCVIPAAIVNPNISAWTVFDHPIRLVASFYSGMVGSALAFCLMTWTIKKKGPLYVSVFSPLLLVLVAFLSWALLREKIYTGTPGVLMMGAVLVFSMVHCSVFGSVLIVLGLYVVIWGKNKEEDEASNHQDSGLFEDTVAERVHEMHRRGGKAPVEEEEECDIRVAMDMKPSSSLYEYYK